MLGVEESGTTQEECLRRVLHTHHTRAAVDHVLLVLHLELLTADLKKRTSLNDQCLFLFSPCLCALRVRMHACMHAHIHSVCACVCVCVRARVRVCVHTCMCVHKFMPACVLARAGRAGHARSKRMQKYWGWQTTESAAVRRLTEALPTTP